MPALLLVFLVRPFMSGRTEERIALPPDQGQEVQGFPVDRQLQDKRPGMPDDPSCHGKDLPADGAQRPGPARGRKQVPFEPDEEVVRQNSDPEEDRVGVKIPGGQVSHPHVVLQPLEKILEISSQLVPLEDPGGTPLRTKVGRDHPIPPGDQIGG